MALPNLTPEQRQLRLQRRRLSVRRVSLIKDDLKAGKMTLEHALTLPKCSAARSMHCLERCRYRHGKSEAAHARLDIMRESRVKVLE